MMGKHETYWIIACLAVALSGTTLLLKPQSRPQKPAAPLLQEIKILPLGTAVQSEDIALLKDITSHDFPAVKVSVEKPFEIPDHAYENGRRQLDAYILLNDLLKKPEEKSVRVIGITTMDLSAPGFKFVFSNVQLGKNVMVVSLKRITAKDPDLKRDRYRKILLRVLGLSFGFKTSNDRTCVMAFSRSSEELDAKGTKWCGREAEEIKNIATPPKVGSRAT